MSQPTTRRYKIGESLYSEDEAVQIEPHGVKVYLYAVVADPEDIPTPTPEYVLPAPAPTPAPKPAAPKPPAPKPAPKPKPAAPKPKPQWTTGPPLGTGSTYYEVLGISNPHTWSRTLKELTKYYRRAALKTHPDKQGGDATAFRAVKEAYEHLKQYATY